MKCLTKDGLDININNQNIKYFFQPYCVLADTPAKAMVVNQMSFMGYYSCPYCLIKGNIILLKTVYEKFKWKLNIQKNKFKESYLIFYNLGYRNCNNTHRFDTSDYELRKNFKIYYEFGD
jgi:hypothetical protein